MKDDTTPITVRILDKEYRVACPASEREALISSAEYLSDKMKDIRDSGKVVGADRIAVMAALNLSHELLKSRSETYTYSDTLADRIRQMQHKIGIALSVNRQLEI